jgi:hypothetical protein
MRGEEDRNQLKISFKETEDLFLRHFHESPISSGIADCGALCNEPTPKFGDRKLYLKNRLTLTEAGINQVI